MSTWYIGKKEDTMPRGNRTGPDGMGSMTGRGAGFCSGSGRPGYMNPDGGRGLGRGYGYAAGAGRGTGFGHGHGTGAGYGQGLNRGYAYAPPPPMAPDMEKQQLQREAEYVEEELKAIRKRLDDLGAQAGA